MNQIKSCILIINEYLYIWLCTRIKCVTMQPTEESCFNCIYAMEIFFEGWYCNNEKVNKGKAYKVLPDHKCEYFKEVI